MVISIIIFAIRQVQMFLSKLSLNLRNFPPSETSKKCLVCVRSYAIIHVIITPVSRTIVLLPERHTMLLLSEVPAAWMGRLYFLRHTCGSNLRSQEEFVKKNTAAAVIVSG